MRVGISGLGRMGVPMAENLLRAGYQVIVWNRSPAKARAFVEERGAGIADTPRELADTTEIVLTMLADDAASNEVHLGPDGLFETPGGADIIVEMGTMSPIHIAELRDRTGTQQDFEGADPESRQPPDIVESML